MRIDIRHALAIALASSLASLPIAGCGDDSTAGSGGGGGGRITDPKLTKPFLCETGDEPFEALRQELGLDSIEERQQAEDSGDVEVMTLVGEPCATATDRPTCEASARDARSDESLFSICGGCFPALQYLVSTRGDEVQVVSTHDAMLAWLGAVDGPGKAWLVAVQAGYSPQCNDPWIREDGADKLLLTSALVSDCPMQSADVLLRVHPDGSVEEVERVVLPAGDGCAGRRPEGLGARHPGPDEPALGAYFAHLGHLEAASVDAFRILADELRAHSAPGELIRRADAAAEDEVRHAELMRGLAERHGAVVDRPEVPRGPVRSLEAIAIENAREGCVRESYGALEAMWQARFAEDHEVRRAFETIARDETAHAALSWDVAAWLESRLDDDARDRVVAARHSAIAELAGELNRRRSVRGAAKIGRPDRQRASDLFGQLQPALA